MPLGRHRKPPGFLKRAVLSCKTARFRMRNRPFRNSKWHVTQGENKLFWGCFCGFLDRFCCTIWPIGLVSRIKPVSCGCTFIFRVFAGGGILFSNTRILRGVFLAVLTLFALFDTCVKAVFPGQKHFYRTVSQPHTGANCCGGVVACCCPAMAFCLLFA